MCEYLLYVYLWKVFGNFYFSETHNRKIIFVVLQNLQYDRVSHLRLHISEIPLVILIGFIVLFLFHSSNWINVYDVRQRLKGSMIDFMSLYVIIGNVTEERSSKI